MLSLGHPDRLPLHALATCDAAVLAASFARADHDGPCQADKNLIAIHTHTHTTCFYAQKEKPICFVISSLRTFPRRAGVDGWRFAGQTDTRHRIVALKVKSQTTNMGANAFWIGNGWLGGRGARRKRFDPPRLENLLTSLSFCVVFSSILRSSPESPSPPSCSVSLVAADLLAFWIGKTAGSRFDSQRKNPRRHCSDLPVIQAGPANHHHEQELKQIRLAVSGYSSHLLIEWSAFPRTRASAFCSSTSTFPRSTRSMVTLPFSPAVWPLFLVFVLQS